MTKHSATQEEKEVSLGHAEVRWCWVEEWTGSQEMQIARVGAEQLSSENMRDDLGTKGSLR